ncbi:MAG TPA: thiol peroxidase [Candidatus Margulisiibacteriota bacterium]|nr:thiol peroxidase [Candidatus Margulisiibacteriota bacterium]
MLRKITFKASPLTLVGRALEVSRAAPGFKAVSPELKETSLADFKGKIKVISSFPSLDTPVCDLQIKEFNKKAASLSEEVVVIGISKDLPFAQKRFCSLNGIENEILLSDYKYSSFGINYGMLIRELNLLARGVFILDKADIIRYIQIAEELSQALNLEEAYNALKEVIKDPQEGLREELPSHCKPCEEGTPPLPKDKVDKLLASYRGWQLVEDKKLVKEFRFKDFAEAKYFLDLVAFIAEEQGHHPTLTLLYDKLRVTLTTHAAGGLTENDFIMAKIIDEAGGAR